MNRYLPAAAVVAYLLLAYREKGFLKGLAWPTKSFQGKRGARSFLLAAIETGAKYATAVILVALSLWGSEAIVPSSLLIRSAVFALLAFVAVSILGPVSYLATLVMSFCVLIIWKE